MTSKPDHILWFHALHYYVIRNECERVLSVSAFTNT